MPRMQLKERKLINVIKPCKQHIKKTKTNNILFMSIFLRYLFVLSIL